MASLKPPDFPIATPNQEDLKDLTLFFRVHEKLSELWLGIDKCLLSQVTTQGAGEKFLYIFEIAGAQGAGERLSFNVLQTKSKNIG